LGAALVITILQIGYDTTLLQTRALLLRRQGYRVISAMGNGTAFSAAATERVDLVLIGHSAPVGIRENAVIHFKDHFPSLPVIALRPDSFHCGLQNADYNADADEPDDWLNTVAQAASRQIQP
jgi:hypothetical protein